MGVYGSEGRQAASAERQSQSGKGEALRAERKVLSGRCYLSAIV